MKLLKLAMAATGIGLAVVLVGALAERFIGSAEAAEKLNKKLEKIESDKVEKVARDTAAAEVALAKAAEKAKQFQDDLKALGIDQEEFKSGLTSAEKALSESFSRMISNANVSSDQLMVGFGNAIQNVGLRGLKAFESQAVAAFGIGKLSAEQFAAAISVADERRKELTNGTMDLEAAYKTLGITSQAALQKVAASAKDAYETIVRQGGTLADQAAAWKVYAEKAIAANGGVASSILQAEAAQHGLTIAIDESGKASIRTKEALEGIADAARRAAQEVTAANTAAMESAAIAASQARTSIGSMQGSIDGFFAHVAEMNKQATAAAQAYNQAFYEQNKDIWGRLTEIVNKEMGLQANSVIRAEPGLTATKLSSKFNRNKSAKEIKRALEVLVSMAPPLIEARKNSNTGGRAAIEYHPYNPNSR